MCTEHNVNSLGKVAWGQITEVIRQSQAAMHTQNDSQLLRVMYHGIHFSEFLPLNDNLHGIWLIAGIYK
jgi:hypothetical protein